VSAVGLPDELEETAVSVRRTIAEKVVARLLELRLTIATAESLTGGMLAAALTAVPGASAVFRGGVVAYATPIKHTLLGVDAGVLAASGPVDAEVARQLAEGARTALAVDGRPADVGVATTGVAGPTRQGGVTVGTVFVAVATASGVSALKLHLDGDRDAIRTETVRQALRLVRRSL